MPTGNRTRKKLGKASVVKSSRRVELDFPARMVTQPLLYHLVKKFDLVPNIRRANITQKFGYIQLELHGSENALDKGISWLVKQGVRVEPIVKDVLES